MNFSCNCRFYYYIIRWVAFNNIHFLYRLDNVCNFEKQYNEPLLLFICKTEFRIFKSVPDFYKLVMT